MFGSILPYCFFFFKSFFKIKICVSSMASGYQMLVVGWRVRGGIRRNGRVFEAPCTEVFFFMVINDNLLINLSP